MEPTIETQPAPIDLNKPAPIDDGSSKDPMLEISDALKGAFKGRLSSGKRSDSDSEKKSEEDAKKKKDEDEAKKKADEEAKDKDKKPEKKDADPDKIKDDKSIKVSKKKINAGESAVIKMAADAAATARSALELASGIKKSSEPATKGGVVEDATKNLPKEYQEDIPVLMAMEKKFPDKYTGLTKKFIDASVKTDQYKKQWEKQNPGHRFDPSDDAHDDFFSNNEVDWNDRDYSRALASMEIEGELKTEREKLDRRIDEIETKDLARDIEPQVRQRQGSEARALISEIDKDFAGMVKENGQLDQAEIDKLKASDPVKANVLLSCAGETARFVAEAERLLHPSGRFQYDDKNPVHVELYNLAIGTERQLLAQPVENRLNQDGKMFATRAEWLKLSKDDQSRRWRLEKDDLIELKRRQQRFMAENIIKQEEEKLQAIAKSRGWVTNGKPKTDNVETKKDDSGPPSKPKPASPSATDDSKVDTSGNVKTTDSDEIGTKLKNAMRGNRIK